MFKLNKCSLLAFLHFLSLPQKQGTLRIRADLTRTAYQENIGNGNRTEWSPIRSVIIQVITKSDDRAAGVRFVYHKYDFRLDWTTGSLIAS